MSATSPLRIDSVSRLDADQVRAVTELVREVTAEDGVRPLSEHVMLHLRYGGDAPARNVLGYLGDELAGYGHLDITDPVAGPSGELAVRPAHRGLGVGRALVEALSAQSPDGRLRLWAHGEQAAAAALANRMGFVQARRLWQLRRSLYAPLPRPQLPAGVTVRAFRPGADEERWLQLNNRAFADHPEQGRWTLDDLRHRTAEPWFDPAGFFLAEQDDRLVGFHWTKVHGADVEHGHEPIGEVYVIGVDPQTQGSGLGKALTLVGLQSLRDRGLPQVMLYVDESNTAAIRLYERLGFSRWDVDISFLRTEDGGDRPVPPGES